MTLFQASKKSNEKIVYSNLKDNREVGRLKFKLVKISQNRRYQKSILEGR